MKVSLVVAQGVHQGKVIPIPVSQFLIGREDGCQLRPSSPAISKKHCAVIARGGKVFVQDFGSTNGTFVNDAPVSGEAQVENGDRIRVGPLEFTIKIDALSAPSRLQPKPIAAEAPTPAPKEAPTKEEKPVARKPAASKPSVKPAGEPDADQLAAMLLSTDDGPTAGGPLTEDQIPSGSTVFDLGAIGGEDPSKKPEQKKAPTAEGDNSKRAAEILRKYMQRPRTT